MVEGLAKGIAALFAALLLLAGAPALAGSTFAPGSTCFAADSDKIGYGALSSNPGRWTCDRAEWSIAADRVILRMDLADGATAGADTLTMRTTRFESMVLTAQNARGQTARATYQPDDLTLETFDWLMSAPIPKLADTPKVVWAKLKRRAISTCSQMRNWCGKANFTLDWAISSWWSRTVRNSHHSLHLQPRVLPRAA